MKNTPIPVTIITGFLGAGKTSLLNELLQKHTNTNFLIIENEAGNINIDSKLIQKNPQSQVFELTGGCICCSLNTELGTVLNRVILSRVQYDYLLIEATGMADTGQIIDVFSGARVQRYFKLDGVVGLVDATTFTEHLPHFKEVRSQIAKSDMVLNNKCDLVNEEQKQVLKEKLKAINPLAAIEETTYGKVDKIQILNSGSYNPTKIEETIIDFTSMTLRNAPQEHIHNIQTLSYTLSGDFDMERMAHWFDTFLVENKILRVKAIISVYDLKHKLILQSVGDSYHTSQGSMWTDNESRESKIVFIGTKLDNAKIKNELEGLVLKS